uniref:Ig-like domain-containing protein n=1 Tax=Sinocyclocheilus rhinocerous TaxID=307959 RepID=A0A673IF07_9TELE
NTALLSFKIQCYFVSPLNLSTVPPSTQLYTKSDVKLGVENTLICSVTNFHPPPVNISWTRNGEAVSEQDVSETQYYSNPDFSFRLFSYLNFRPERGDIYTCSVQLSVWCALQTKRFDSLD